MSSITMLDPLTRMNPFRVREPFDTGEECVCSNCHGHFVSWVIVEGRKGKETRRAAEESHCSECDCRRVKGVLQPCARYDDPRTGIRIHPAPNRESAGWVRLEHEATKRLHAWFPGEAPFSGKMRPVLEEIDLFVRLRELFPNRPVARLLEIRKGMRPFVCPRCGQPVDWRIKTDYAQAKAAREAYHDSLDEDL